MKADAYCYEGFYINLPAGAFVVLFLFFIHIPGPEQQTPITSTIQDTLKSLDLVGFVLFAPSAIMFLLALEWGGNQYKWNSATVIGLFCGAGGTFAVFLGWEYKKGATAMIPFGMVKRRSVYSSGLTMGFLAASISTTSYYMSIYFQAVRGDEPLMAGVYLLPSILGQMLTAVTSGILSWYPHKWMPIYH